jgi:hypothetical protein
MLLFLIVVIVGGFLVDLYLEELQTISRECTDYGGKFTWINPGNFFFPDDREFICIFKPRKFWEVDL